MEYTGNNSSLNVSNSTMTEQATGSAHKAIDQLSDVARPAISRTASRAHHLVDRLSGTTSRVAERLGKMKEAEQRLVGASSSYVRTHPFQSAGIALAAGYLMSRLVISRRPKSISGNMEETKSPERSQSAAVTEQW